MGKHESGFASSAFNNLNFVRALSGFTVVLSHFFSFFVLPVAGPTTFRTGVVDASTYAVLAFFALSGFLIALSIQRNITRYGYFSWREYLVSRTARIYPALVASVLLCLALYGLILACGLGGAGALSRPGDMFPAVRTAFSLSAGEVVFTLLQTYAFGPGGYLTVNGPLWSLSYEVGFYLLAGLVMTALKGRGSARVVAVFLAVGVAAMAAYFGKYLFLHYGTIWVLGVGLFFALESRASGEARLRRVACLALLLAVLTGTNWILVYWGFKGPLRTAYTASLAIILVLYGASRSSVRLPTAVAKMSDSTYTLYLFHFPLLLVAYAFIRDLFDHSPVLYFGATVVITAALFPLCHVAAGFLEKRQRWEGVIRIFVPVPRATAQTEPLKHPAKTADF